MSFWKNIFGARDKKPPLVVKNQDLKALIRRQLANKLTPSSIILLTDEQFTAIDKYRVMDIYQRSGLNSNKFKKEKHDCDDFALLLKAKFIEAVASDHSTAHAYAFGIVMGNMPTPHAVNWFLTPDMEILFIEPQTGDIMKPVGSPVFFMYS